MKSRALVFNAPCSAAVQDVEVPHPGPGQVCVEIRYSCMSPGTESRVFAGTQTGAPPFPLIPGYSASGIIAAVGEGVALQMNTPVFVGGGAVASIPGCWGAHIQYAVVQEKSVVPLPEGVGLRAASAGKLAAIAFHGVRLANPLPDMHVSVLGLGPIGFFSALLHQACGARVEVYDRDPTRQALAGKLGLHLFDPGPGVSRDAEIVVDATGAAPALTTAARLLRQLPWDDEKHIAPRLVIQGSYASPPPLPYDELFLAEAAVLVPRDNQRRDIIAVLDLMQAGRFDIDGLLADLGSPAQANEVYQHPAEALAGSLTGVFDWAS